jgi:hypothetical protein
MADVPPEVRKEFEDWLDDYAKQYRKAIDRIMRSRDKHLMPVGSESEVGRPGGTAAEQNDALQGGPDPKRG